MLGHFADLMGELGLGVMFFEGVDTPMHTMAILKWN